MRIHRSAPTQTASPRPRVGILTTRKPAAKGPYYRADAAINALDANSQKNDLDIRESVPEPEDEQGDPGISVLGSSSESSSIDHGGKSKHEEIPVKVENPFDEESLFPLKVADPSTPPSSAFPSPSVPEVLPRPAPDGTFDCSAAPSSSGAGNIDAGAPWYDHVAPREAARGELESAFPRQFTCGINGCNEVLPFDYTRVRAHFRFNVRHHNHMIIKDDIRLYRCPFAECSFKNASEMRVAEHICSPAHFNMPNPCPVPACGKIFPGGFWALFRHRRMNCVFCEGCQLKFGNVEVRKLHESTCPSAPLARTSRLKRKVEIEEEEGADRRRYGKQPRVSEVPECKTEVNRKNNILKTEEGGGSKQN